MVHFVEYYLHLLHNHWNLHLLDYLSKLKKTDRLFRRQKKSILSRGEVFLVIYYELLDQTKNNYSAASGPLPQMLRPLK